MKGTISLKINNISTYMTQIDQLAESPRQLVAGIEWHVHALPSVVDNVTYLACYLEGANESAWTAWVDANFGIVAENGGGFGNEKNFRKRLMGTKPLVTGWGWKKFVKSEVFSDICGKVKYVL